MGMTTEEALAVCQDRPALVLEMLYRHRAAHPGDADVARLLSSVLGSVFSASRRAFAEGRLLDSVQLFAALADYGGPQELLRADLHVALGRLIQHALEALEAGDVATARRECRQALAVAPDFSDTLTALAFLERRHGHPAVALRATLWALRVDPDLAHGALHRDIAVGRAGETLLEALYEQPRRGEVAALVSVLMQADEAFATPVRALIKAGGGPCDLERTLRLWLGRRAMAKRDYPAALGHFSRASAIHTGPETLDAEGEARQYLMLEQLRGSLQSHCSAYINDPVGRDANRRIFQRLDALMVQALSVDNIDHWTRTQLWGVLTGWRSMLDYAAALGRSPYLPSQAGPFKPPAEARNGERRLFDCCTFFNEAEILEIRLRELYDVVDGFVVAEATHTHAGQPKELTFPQHRERFRPWSDKITYVVDDDVVDGFSWRREAHQRDCLLRGLTGCRDDDIVIVSDVDEIVRRETAASLRRVEPDCQAVFTLEMDLFFYRLNYRFRQDWGAAGAAPYRIVKQTGANAVRYLALQKIGPLAADAGWHFSWIGDVDRFVAKMTAYAHQEHAAEYAAGNREQREAVRRFLTEGGPVPDCGPGSDLGAYTALPVDERFPLLVREAYDRFAALQWIGAPPANAGRP